MPQCEIEITAPKYYAWNGLALVASRRQIVQVMHAITKDNINKAATKAPDNSITEGT